MEQFDSFEKCCAALGLDPEKVLPDVSSMPERHQLAVTNYAKMVIVTEAVNQDWKPDWNDRDQEKWYPWFDMETDRNNPSGFRFDGSLCAYASTGSTGGSRLCYVDEETSDFVGKHYEDLFRGMMVLEPEVVPK